MATIAGSVGRTTRAKVLLDLAPRGASPAEQLALSLDVTDYSVTVAPELMDVTNAQSLYAQYIPVGPTRITLRMEGVVRDDGAAEAVAPETDARRMARAVLEGEDDIALVLADEVHERHLTGHRGTPYLSRQQMADRCLKLACDVIALREALRPFADAANTASNSFVPDTALVYVGPERCSLTVRDLNNAALALQEVTE